MFEVCSALQIILSTSSSNVLWTSARYVTMISRFSFTESGFILTVLSHPRFFAPLAAAEVGLQVSTMEQLEGTAGGSHLREEAAVDL